MAVAHALAEVRASAAEERDDLAREAAVLGMTVEFEEVADDDEVVEVWDEHWQAFELLQAMGTQLRVGPSGLIGIDFGPLPGVMDVIGIAPEDRRQAFMDFRVLERAWVKEIKAHG